MNISPAFITALREACRELGESSVTLATPSGVITFTFHPEPAHAKGLAYESQPSRQELMAMLDNVQTTNLIFQP